MAARAGPLRRAGFLCDRFSTPVRAATHLVEKAWQQTFTKEFAMVNAVISAAKLGVTDINLTLNQIAAQIRVLREVPDQCGQIDREALLETALMLVERADSQLNSLSTTLGRG